MKTLLGRILFTLDVDLRASTGEAVNLAAAAIKWALRNPDVSVTIIAMNSPAEVYECVQIAEQATLSEGEWKILERARDAFMSGVDGDAGFPSRSAGEGIHRERGEAASAVPFKGLMPTFIM